MKSLFGHAERRKGGRREGWGGKEEERREAEERKKETNDHRRGKGQEEGEEKAGDRGRQFIKKHMNLKERLKKRGEDRSGAERGGGALLHPEQPAGERGRARRNTRGESRVAGERWGV